jgi:hypothetical protein
VADPFILPMFPGAYYSGPMKVAGLGVLVLGLLELCACRGTAKGTDGGAADAAPATLDAGITSASDGNFGDGPEGSEVSDGAPAGSTADGSWSVAQTLPPTAQVTVYVSDVDQNLGLDFNLSTATQTISGAGTATFSAPLGRFTATLTANGFWPLVRELPVAADGIDLHLKLLSKAAPTTLSAGGTMVPLAFGTDASGQPLQAVLEVPAAAFMSDTDLTVQWLQPSEIAASPGPAMFVDSAGKVQRVLGALLVDIASEPLVPALLHLPLSAELMGQTLTLFELAPDGSWWNGIPPMGIGTATVTFELPHFSSWGFAVEGDLSGSRYVVLDAEGASCAAGDLLPEGAAVATSESGFVILADPLGSVIRVGPDSQLTMGPIASTPASDPDLRQPVEPGAGSASLERGQAQGMAKRSARETLRIRPSSCCDEVCSHRCATCAVGVRGTVFTAGAPPCADGSRARCELSVSEGSVDFLFGGAISSVAAGHRVEACSGCTADPALPADQGGCAGTPDLSDLSGTYQATPIAVAACANPMGDPTCFCYSDGMTCGDGFNRNFGMSIGSSGITGWGCFGSGYNTTIESRFGRHLSGKMYWPAVATFEAAIAPTEVTGSYTGASFCGAFGTVTFQVPKAN